jgi:hypothetical protein
MGFDQYHEPPDEPPAAARTFARLCASLKEEAEAETFEDGAEGAEGGYEDGPLGIGSLRGETR